MPSAESDGKLDSNEESNDDKEYEIMRFNKNVVIQRDSKKKGKSQKGKKPAEVCI